MPKKYLVLVPSFLFLTACESNPLDGLGPSYMVASFAGAIEQEYQGTGEFHTGTPSQGKQQFQITSQGTGASANQKFAITRWNGGRLSEGRYSLALVAPVGERELPEGLTVQFARREGNIEEQFVAESGELEITTSTEKLFTGRFHLTAFRYCSREIVRSTPAVPPVGPCTPHVEAPPADAPRIAVSGSFAATPLEIFVSAREGN